MSDFKPRPGTFLPYLEAGREDKPAVQARPTSPLTLLEILSRQAQRSLPIFDLQTLSGMEPSRYAEALRSLRNEGYVAIEGDAPDQKVLLTDSGASVAKLARPA